MQSILTEDLCLKNQYLLHYYQIYFRLLFNKVVACIDVHFESSSTICVSWNGIRTNFCFVVLTQKIAPFWWVHIFQCPETAVLVGVWYPRNLIMKSMAYFTAFPLIIYVRYHCDFSTSFNVTYIFCLELESH